MKIDCWTKKLNRKDAAIEGVIPIYNLTPPVFTVSKAITVGDSNQKPSHRPDKGKRESGTLVTGREFREDRSRKEEKHKINMQLDQYLAPNIQMTHFTTNPDYQKNKGRLFRACILLCYLNILQKYNKGILYK